MSSESVDSTPEEKQGMKTARRSEIDVFAELTALTREPGYIHAIAQICFRDNFVTYAKELKAPDLKKLFNPDRLIRTEINTLLGLLMRGPVDFSQPAVPMLEQYVKRTDLLMRELHAAIGSPMWDAIGEATKTGITADIWRGNEMREPIFYGSESAYSFQYRDLVSEKYGADDPWLVRHKGFSITQARVIARTMCSLLEEKATLAFRTMREAGKAPISWLPTFEQTPNEIADQSGVPVAQVLAFLNAFTFRGDNPQFQSVSDFNAINATPLLASEGEKVLLLQQYSIYEAIYESPFYWMIADNAYKATAAQHRGKFTETFATQRLANVFGKQCVYPNVGLIHKKGVLSGEIDVLVVYGDRLIIVQAKSKRLTLEARRGNDGQLRQDFANAIQDSYDQAWQCANAILESNCKLVDANGVEIVLSQPPNEILIFNVIADHYPALAFQVRQYLKYHSTAQIRAPFVMDVFFLDVLTEMLETPLRLLSYAKLRVDNVERLSSSHELTALGFHLKRNLWIEREFDMVMLQDDLAIDLDVAMAVRRDNRPGSRTPKGILTHFSGSLFEQLIVQIENRTDPAILELGFLLLKLGEATCRNIDYGLTFITSQTRADGKLHDFSIGGDYGGITFHCNATSSEDARRKLGVHCERRKYEQRAQRWFGLSLDFNAKLQFGVLLDFEWRQSDEMDLATADMRRLPSSTTVTDRVRGVSQCKVGRNDPCPCGSGMKFKKCCLRK